MGILDSIFGGKKSNPASAASPYLDQLPGLGAAYLAPYINNGNTAQINTRGQYETMMANPTGFMDYLMSGYKPSGAYNLKKDLLTKQLSNTANAGGIAGTPTDQLNQTETVHNLLSEDMQEFLTNALGIHRTGLEGEQGIADKGFESSKSLLDLLGQTAGSQASLAYKGQENNNSTKSGFLQFLAKALGAGAGAVFGGPAGAAGGLKGANAGSKLAGNIFGSI